MGSYLLSSDTVERFEQAAGIVLGPGSVYTSDGAFASQVPLRHAVLITSETATDGRYPCKLQWRDEENETWQDFDPSVTGWAIAYNGDSRAGEPLAVTTTRYDGMFVSELEDGTGVWAVEINNPTSHSRWLRFTNEELIDTIPAYGLVRITGSTETPVFEGRKPDRSDPLYTWVNGPDAVAPDAVGYCTRDFPAWVAYDESDGPPLPGEEWGPVPDGFKLRKGVAGYVVVGATTGDTGSKRVQVIHASAERPFWAKITSTDGAGAYSWIEVAAGAGGTWASPTAAREGKIDTDPWQNPAYELNHKLDVAVGTIVRMWRAYWENYLTGEYQEYTFLVGGGSGGFWASVGGGNCTEGRFSITEVEPQPGGTWRAREGGILSDYAYHVNKGSFPSGGPLVAAGTIVWARAGAVNGSGNQEYVFDCPAGWTGTRQYVADVVCCADGRMRKLFYYDVFWNGSITSQPCHEMLPGPCVQCQPPPDPCARG